ncbi:DNA annealing helicase and endonuclease ZRANB3 isoform X3 [Syngnathoides biaculeatus]|uniref:DNA annealing helicase and endonuclease ZRANB3 isoform X3 n=2 Tax=Syngnathoides biaculeatus TaxID=300417 RepID=UPI002ADDC137|nr:DNA annealing helicase and endonuclease ZRANB3 isoform X3 [Syngnathoides biaculeatus]
MMIQATGEDVIMTTDGSGPPQPSYCDTRWSQQMSRLPPKLLERLMPFQREGVRFALSKNGRCMIADEMGLGKTVQAIAVSYAFRKEWPLLVVVPSSLKYLWIEELERWIPELQPGDINLVENKSDTMGISRSKVTVLGYGLLTTDARPLVEALSRRAFSVVVVDESHYLKSRNAARTKLLVPLIRSAKRAILLTGTPALGRPEELFMQIDALYPKMFGTWTDYAKKYCNAHYRYFGPRRQWDCRGASNLEELHQQLSQIMIRRLKAKVLSQLPPKIRQRIPFDLPKDAAKEATASFAEWERLMKGSGSEVVAISNSFAEVMSLITRMYKQTATAKAGAVKDYIKMMLDTEQLKFLVFAHHLTMLQACTEAAIEAKAGYIRIDGSVPSSERVQLVHKFQNDPETRVAILSIQAAGQGLTFTAASHVVFAELYWNPGHIKQAEDRAHRIGQTSSVNVHYLIANGTFDSVMWSMLNRKESVTGSTLNGRKEYLKAEEGDKDKWDFLNFASAWTPGKLLLERNTGLDADEDVYFTHFEREKQHDIRNFFSPSTNREKKRKRLQDEAESSYTSSEINNSAACSGAISETKKEESFQASITDNCDFSPQIKRIRELRSSPSQRSGFKVRRRVKQEASMPACFMAQQYLLESNPSCEPWACAVCTYSNNNLLPYCEMCEAPRSSSVLISEPTRSESPPAETEQMCHIQSNSDQELELSCQKLHTTKLCKGKQSGEEDELPKDKQKARETRGGDNQQLKGKQSMEKQGGGSGTGGGSCVLLEHAHELKANDSEEGGDPAYQSLLFCASQYTDRIYIYNKDGAPLNLSFIPLDIKLTNWDDLPEDFSQHRENRLQVLRFVQEWCGLAAMKQKLLRRSNLFYHSPTLGLQQLATSQRQHNSTRRYLTRDDVAQASLSQAQQEGGSVRVVAKEDFFRKRKSISSLNSLISVRFPMTSPHSQESLVHHFVCLKQGKRLSPNSSGKFVVEQPTPGFLQAMDRQCVPLCLSCQKACLTTCRAWDTRFCSNKCQEEFHLRSSQTYMRSRVLEVERGVCQHCGLHAHDLFVKVRDAPPFQRKEILENTWLAQLSLKQLNEMIRAPVEGDFWQVDHIRPVYSGGGQCSLDNLQTLCTVCHRARTAQQAKERSQMRKSATASKVASDISRFFIKK